MSDAANQVVPAPQVASRAKTFFRRLLTTGVLWTVILAALFSGRPLVSQVVFVVIILILAVLGTMEFYGLVKARGLVCFPAWGVGGAVLLVAGTFYHLTWAPPSIRAAGGVPDFEIGFLILFVLGLGLRQLSARDNPHGLQAIGLTLLGLIYVPFLLNFIQKINYFPGVNGTLFLLYFLLVTKLSDSGAYLVGSLLGRHKMIPRISPGKTWEGFAGAVLVPVVASLLFVHAAGERLAVVNGIHGWALGCLLGVGAVAGDLIESLFKREAGLKDSGRFFPGIGGILDLLDSLLFNAPLMYLYLRYVLSPA